ncbi:Bgt-4137 [Blumeria graminis f. sp. tritici]|nr:Bgt-4137 [Blumeria graminis f. sp. tritici]
MQVDSKASKKLSKKRLSRKIVTHHGQKTEPRPKIQEWMMNDNSLKLPSRFVEVVRDAQFRDITEPLSRDDLVTKILKTSNKHHSNENITKCSKIRSLHAQHNWRKVRLIMRRAVGNEDSSINQFQKRISSTAAKMYPERSHKKMAPKKEVRKMGRIMDLRYFLEMIDIKHRYGPNLRIYHEEWKKSETRENFFYWLDHGEGLHIDFQVCSRAKLERERVRYLTTEERRKYLVIIDGDGRLCWAKNGTPIDTSENYQDSIHGIIPITDSILCPEFSEIESLSKIQKQPKAYYTTNNYSASSSISSVSCSDLKYGCKVAYDTIGVPPAPEDTHDVKRIHHVSKATIIDRLLRGSVQKNTWIFVVDSSFRLYVGIKQSGIFQHSSFSRGCRISAAGGIKIKNGRLTSLSPLSGHYRPPVANFRAFVQALQEAGADVSHLSISRAYTILVGFETYKKTRQTAKHYLDQISMKRNKPATLQISTKREKCQR